MENDFAEREPELAKDIEDVLVTKENILDIRMLAKVAGISVGIEAILQGDPRTKE